jgi:hypothetical protein
MEQALLVSEQHTTWEVLATHPRAAARDQRGLEEPGDVSPSTRSENWRTVPTTPSASSPFEYQCAVIQALWLPVAKSRSLEYGPRNAKQALEQIRTLHRKHEARRREQEEAEWIRANRTRYAGRWVALSGQNLIAEAATSTEVAQAASSTPSPLIVYIDNDLPFAGW